MLEQHFYRVCDCVKDVIYNMRIQHIHHQNIKAFESTYKLISDEYYQLT